MDKFLTALVNIENVHLFWFKSNISAEPQLYGFETGPKIKTLTRFRNFQLGALN